MPEDPMPCGVLEQDLSALVDGELAESRANELREHVSGCARCTARVDAFEAANVRLASLPVRSVPADLRARLQARIDAEEAESAAPDGRRTSLRPPPPTRRRWLASPALATAAALAAAVALYWVLVPGDAIRPGTSELPPMAHEEPAPAPEPDPLPIRPEPVAPQIAETPAPLPPELEAPQQAPPTEVAVVPPAPEVSPSSDVEFDAVPAEEIELALELDTIEDLDVIANLEVLEALVALSEGTG